MFRRLPKMRVSLRQVFIYLTVFCVGCHVVARYPNFVESITKVVVYYGLLVGPSVLICTWIAASSSRPLLPYFTGISGTLMGIILSPELRGHAEFWVLPLLGIDAFGSPPDVGAVDFVVPPLMALLLGGIGSYVIRHAETKH